MSKSDSIITLLKQASSNGIKLWVEDGRLKFKAKHGISDEFKSNLRDRKVDLINFLSKKSIKVEKADAEATYFPLLPMQVDIINSIELSQQKSLYNVPIILEYSGSLDTDKLQSALGQLIQQNPILSSKIIKVNDIYQHKLQESPVNFNLHDLCKSSYDQDQLNTLCSQIANYAFNVTTGPLYHAAVIKLSANKYLLCFVFHHVVFDGLSMDLFLDKLHRLYTSDTFEVNSSQFEFIDFINWFKKHQVYSKTENEDFWRQSMTSLQNLNLPFDKEATKQREYKGKRHYIEVPAPLSKQLNERIGSELKSTEFNFFFSVYSLFLRDFCNQSTVSIGIATTLRKLSEFNSSIGMFVNALPACIEIPDQAVISDFVTRVSNLVQSVFNHNSLCAQDINKLIKPQSTNGTDLFETMFLFEEETRSERSFCDGSFTDRPRVNQDIPAKFNLTLSVIRKLNSCYLIEFEYDTSQFTENMVQRFCKGYIELLEQIAKSDFRNKDIGTLRVINQQEQHWLLHTFNDVPFEYQSATILELFFENEKKHSEELAVKGLSGQFTYKQLNMLSLKFAKWLLKKLSSKQGVIAIKLTRDIFTLPALLGILRAGKAYMPIDPEYPNERIDYILKDSGAELLVYDRKTETEEHQSTQCESINIESFFNDTNDSALEQDLYLNRAKLDEPAYIIYTSGSTGKPKGVIINHRSLSHYCQWACKNYMRESGCGALVHSSLAFDLTVTSLFSPICYGKAVFMIHDGQGVEGLVDAIQSRQDYSLIKITPAHLKILQTKLSTQILSNISSCFVIGGEALYLDDLEVMKHNCKSALFINEYGPTETTVGAMNYAFNADKSDIPQAVPIGRPIGNYKIYLLDYLMRPVPAGVVGEMFISGIGLAEAYLNRPELTQDRFLKNPYRTDSQTTIFYKTGDLAKFLNDEQIHYVGRIDEQIKLNGYRIELGEIEGAFSTLPYLKDAIAVTENEKICVCLVIDTQIDTPQLSDLKRIAANKLPFYMRPAHYYRVNSIPLTTNGKVDRKALIATTCDDDEIKNINTSDNLSETQKQLLTIWQNVFSVKDISIHDDFFSLGGDSLTAIQLVSFIRDIGYSFSTKDLYHLQCIHEIVKSIKLNGKSIQSSQTDQLIGEFPLTPIQKWFFRQQLPNPNHYLQVLPIRLASQYSESTMRMWLNTLMDNIDSARIRFKKDDVHFSQYYLDCEDCEIYSYEVVNQDIIDVDSLVIEDSYRRVDIFDGPLFVIQHFKSEGSNDALLIIAHHLVVDGYSWAVLKEKLSLLLSSQNLPAGSSYKAWSNTIESYAKHPSTVENYLWQKPSYFEEACDSLFTNNAVEGERCSYTFNMPISFMDSDFLSNLSLLKINVGDMILSALCNTVFDYFPDLSEVPITIESFGRAEISPSLNFSNTVGWFTCFYPIQIPQHFAKLSKLSHIKAIQARRIQVPNFGVGYMARHEQKLPPICFNYLGEISEIKQSEGIDELPLGFLPDPISFSNKAVGDFLLEVNAWKEKKTLMLSLNFKIHNTERERAESFVNKLRSYINSSINDISTVDMDTTIKLGGNVIYTEGLKAISEEKYVRAIYPALPGQELMVRQFMQNRQSQGFRSQAFWKLDNTIDQKRLQKKWEKLQRTIDALSVESVTQDGRYYQVIRDDSYNNFHFATVNCQYGRDIFLAYIKKKFPEQFDLKKAPLIRCIVLSYLDTTIVCLDHHHMLLDGQSINTIKSLLDDALVNDLVFDQKLELIKGNKEYFNNYLPGKHLEDIAFWTQYLDKYQGIRALPKAKSRQTLSQAVDSECAVSTNMETNIVKNVTEAAKRLKITVSTLFQHAWGMVLSKELTQQDILFGIVRAGRGNLKSPDNYIGMYMNIVPVRVQCDKLKLSTQLKVLHEDIQDIIEHDSVGLVELEKQKNFQADRELINTIYTFENAHLQSHDETSLEFNTITNSPLTLIVKWSVAPHIVFTYDSNVFDEGYVKSLAKQVVEQVSKESKQVIAEHGLENIFSDVVNRSELKIFGELQMRRDAIVLIHGGMCGYEIFNKLIPSLQKPVIAIDSHNLRCIVDQRDHFITDFYELSRLYLQQINAAAPGKQLTFVAFSQGGLITSAMLEQSKQLGVDIKEIFLLDSFLLSSTEKQIRQKLQPHYVNEICSNQNILKFHGVTTEQMKLLADVELDALMKFELNTSFKSEITLIKAQNAYEVQNKDYQVFLSKLMNQSDNGWKSVAENLTQIILPTHHFGLLDEESEQVAAIINEKLKDKEVA